MGVDSAVLETHLQWIMRVGRIQVPCYDSLIARIIVGILLLLILVGFSKMELRLLSHLLKNLRKLQGCSSLEWCEVGCGDRLW